MVSDSAYRLPCWISPYLAPACPSEPTCSEYARAASSRYGALRGHKLAIFRLLKCYPFHPGGMDPVKW
ncbi:MAG TPA: membrane protein insertion efficiency factor YidD [Nitrospiraceae bacterium]